MKTGFDPDPINDSVHLLADLLLDHSYLTPGQAVRVAQKLCDMAEPDGYEE